MFSYIDEADVRPHYGATRETDSSEQRLRTLELRVKRLEDRKREGEHTLFWLLALPAAAALLFVWCKKESPRVVYQQPPVYFPASYQTASL